MKSSVSREDQAREKQAKSRHAHKEAKAAVTRVLQLVENGTMDANDPGIRDRLVGLKLQRDEHARDIADWQKRLS